MKFGTLFAAAVAMYGASIAARAEVCSSITNAEVTVESRDDEWTAAEIKAHPGDLILVTTGVEVRWRIRNVGSHHDVRYSGVWIAAVLVTPVGRPTQPAVSGPDAIGQKLTSSV